MKKKVLKIKDVHISLILHNIRSCYNVGSIFRTADAVGVDLVYLCGYTPQPSASGGVTGQAPTKIAKTALGAERIVPWKQYRQTWRLLRKLHENGVKIIALEQMPESINIFKYKVPLNEPIALLAGHEKKGLSRKILKHVDKIVEIPMYGQKESLNVSVAVGIAVYKLIN